MNIKETFRVIGLGVKKNAPVLLGGMAVTTTVAATVTGIMAGFRSKGIIHGYAYEIILTETHKPTYLEVLTYEESLTTRDKAELVWKQFVPTAVLSTAGVASILGVLYVTNKRYAALAGVYALTDASFKEYREKVVSHMGEKKEQKVREDIHEDIIRNHDVSDVFNTGYGEHLCLDKLSGRYFRSDLESIRSAINNANEKLVHGQNFMSLNEVYSELGLRPIELGNDIGWNVDALIDLYATSHLAKNGEPCIVIGFENNPSADYY